MLDTGWEEDCDHPRQRPDRRGRTGCRFAPRCPLASDVCREAPPLRRREAISSPAGRPRERRPRRSLGLARHYRAPGKRMLRALDGVDLAIDARRDARPRRRERQRQEHARADARRAANADAGDVRFDGETRRAPPGPSSGAAASAATGVPGPVRRAEPAHDHRRHARRASAGARWYRAGARVVPEVLTQAGLPALRTATRTKFPAASASAR